MVVILNSSAGTAANKTDDTQALIKRAFAAVSTEVGIIQPEKSDDLAATVREAIGSGHETIVAAGGDGTISGVAAELVNTGKIMGILPIGTLNHFAKDLGIPLDLEAAARTIVHGRVRIVDAAEVNGKIFLNNSSLGIYPHIVSRRKAQEQKLAQGKWPAFAWATMQAFRKFPFLDLRISVGDEQRTLRTAFLFVGNNEYEIAGFKLGGRACLDTGKLGLYVTHRTGRLGLFRLALRALLGRVNQARDFDAFCVQEAFIETRHQRLLVATDGEVGWMQTPLHYKSRPGALRVLVPKS